MQTKAANIEILTQENFRKEMYICKKKLELNSKDFKLLIEAYRRKHFLDQKNPNFLGIGLSSEYKSKLFTASFESIIPKSNNWFKLTKLGQEKLEKLESSITFKKENKDTINLLLFNY